MKVTINPSTTKTNKFPCIRLGIASGRPYVFVSKNSTGTPLEGSCGRVSYENTVKFSGKILIEQGL